VFGRVDPTRPLLEIQGASPEERWGLTVHDGYVVAVHLVRSPGDKPGDLMMQWIPLSHMPAKLLEYVDVFIGQHQPWLSPRGMPVGAAPHVLLEKVRK